MVDFTVLGAGGHQGTASIETLVDDVWNTDLEYGLASKRNIDRVVGVEKDSKRLQNLEEELNLNEWQLVDEQNGRKAFEHSQLDTVLELVGKDAVDYLQKDFEGGVVYDGTWTTKREDVAEALADRIKSDDAALLTESSASLFEKPSEPARDPIHRLQALGLPMSENQVEMFSDQKRSVINDIRRNDARVESIETYRISGPGKMVETERNLLKNNEGSTIDKGAHDWGKILATLSASGQVEEDSNVVLDEEESEYRVARVQEDQDIEYTAEGREISGSDLEDLSINGQRLNDGYAEIVAEIEDVDLKVVTGLTGIPEKVRRRAEDLEQKFQAPDESDIDLIEDLDLDEDALNAVNTADLVFDYEGNEEIRAEYVETDQADYLVSTATGGEMFTLKMKEDGLELLAYGPSDWHASFLEEGIDAVENNVEPTVDIGTALETGRINSEVAHQAYRNARGEDATVRVSQYDGLDEILGLEEEYSSQPVPVREKKSSAEI